MKKAAIVFMLLIFFAIPAKATELTAPPVPDSAAGRMPEESATFSEGLMTILKDALSGLRPDLAECLRTCAGVIAAALLTGILERMPDTPGKLPQLAGTLCVAGLLLRGTGSLIRLAGDTIQDMSEYGKLLLPVMTTAMATQGCVTAPAALYAGTAAGNTLLTALIAWVLLPMVYVYLALAAAGSAIEEEGLKRLKELIKGLVGHSLKILLSVFTGYMGITGVVSGTTDAAALKATKLTISGMVPVVGGILSDASEAVLVSAGLVKNAAGVYGILAILAVCLLPFLRIGVHYLMLKGTGAVCAMFAGKRLTALVEDFSGAMGLLLGMTGAECLLLLISTVCFLRGAG